MIALVLFFFVVFASFLLDQLGPKIGVIFIALGLVGSLTWSTYDYFVSKFSIEEKFKL